MTKNGSWETNKANYMFDFRAKSVDCWEDKALSLKAASDKVYINLVETHKIIEQDNNNGTSIEKSCTQLTIGLNSIWMLSVGYSVECLIKAIIISTTSVPVIITDKNGYVILNIGQLFGGKSHDLNSLLKKVASKYRPKFINEEFFFMCKMSSYTTWRGKYPIPVDATYLTYDGQGIEKALIESILNRSERYVEYVETRDDKDKKAYDNVFSKIYDKLSEAKKIGWK